jgi:dTDP-4-amino-4,6-dideoxygalactose transaminase
MLEFGDQELQAATRVLVSGQMFRYLPDAHEADRFETEFADRLGADRAILTSSGTASLICGLTALGIGPGDEVLIPAYGYVADALAPLAVGAVPVVCEIDESLTLDPAGLEDRIGDRTQAIIPIHVHGMACDMDQIMAIASRHGLAVLEDACQAVGGTFRGRHLGTIGDAGAFSFNQHKILTAGEGGALVTNRADVHERAFMCHDGSARYSRHGFTEPFHAGLAFRASEISAAIMRVQLRRLDVILSGLRETRDRLHEAIRSVVAVPRIPMHDPRGECGSNLAYRFEDPETARRFMSAVDGSGVDAFQGVGYGHAFVEWDFIHQRRGGPPTRNPLLTTDVSHDPGSCPKTLEILGCTVLLRYGTALEPGVPERLAAGLLKEFG